MLHQCWYIKNLSIPQKTIDLHLFLQNNIPKISVTHMKDTKHSVPNQQTRVTCISSWFFEIKSIYLVACIYAHDVWPCVVYLHDCTYVLLNVRDAPIVCCICLKVKLILARNWMTQCFELLQYFIHYSPINVFMFRHYYINYLKADVLF